MVDYGLTFTSKQVLLGRHGVALFLHNASKRGDLILNAHLATIFGVRGRKIATINTYLSDVEMINAFFSTRTPA
jgi:hypothetical protein